MPLPPPLQSCRLKDLVLKWMPVSHNKALKEGEAAGQGGCPCRCWCRCCCRCSWWWCRCGRHCCSCYWCFRCRRTGAAAAAEGAPGTASCAAAAAAAVDAGAADGLPTPFTHDVDRRTYTYTYNRLSALLPLLQAPPPSRRCCAARGSCGSPTPTPPPSTGATRGSTLRSGTRGSGELALPAELAVFSWRLRC